MSNYVQSKDLEIMKIAEVLADSVYEEIIRWDFSDKRTIGFQLINSVDSIGANIAESQGRFHLKDSINFLYYARGSVEETKYWLRRAHSRKLIIQSIEKYQNEIEVLAIKLNAFINSKKKKALTIKSSKS